MFHVKQLIENIKNLKIHELLFYVFLFFVPIQTRILFHADLAYTGWYFNYHQAIFLYLSDIILAACFISWILFDQRIVPRKTLIWPIIGLFVWILISLFHVKRIDLGIYQALRWAEILLLLSYLVSTFRFKSQFRRMLGILFITTVSQALLALWQFHVQHMIGFTWLGEYIAPLGTSGLSNINTTTGQVIRAYGTFPHPNVLGAFLLLGLLVGLYFVSYGTKLKKILVSLSIFTLILGLFVSFSRIAWGGTILGAFAYLIYWLKNKRYQEILIIAVVWIVSCATIYIAYGEYLVIRISETTKTTVSITDRSYFNRQGINLIRANPVLGTGVGNYITEMQEKKTLEAWQYQPPHNIFIFTAAELGVVGLLLFALIIFEIFVTANKQQGSDLKFLLLTLGLVFILLGQFDHYFATIQQGRLMFTLAIGMLAALPNLANDRIASSAPSTKLK